MQLLDLTLDDPAANLALDEVLLTTDDGREHLRLWRPRATMVVVGRSTRVEQEVHTERCHAAGVPILRRVSGGATIVTGPGCLMYAVVLDAAATPAAADIDHAHRYVLDRMARALRPLCESLTAAGTSDIALRVGDTLRKVSGNSVRRVRSRLLYHGTLMHAFDLSRIGQLLRTPPRQPDYRAARPHSEFVANLRVSEPDLARAITTEWSAEPRKADASLLAEVEELARTKYHDHAWNFSR